MKLVTMTPEELMTFHDTARAHPRKAARELFPTLPAKSVATARDLAHYAANFATALSCWADGNREGAMLYLKICMRIREDLPAYALPLLGD